jgi:hypothetical protein
VLDNDIPDFFYIYSHIAVNQHITERGNLPPWDMGRFFERFIRNLFYRLSDNLKIADYRILDQAGFQKLLFPLAGKFLNPADTFSDVV